MVDDVIHARYRWTADEAIPRSISMCGIRLTRYYRPFMRVVAGLSLAAGLFSIMREAGRSRIVKGYSWENFFSLRAD